MLKHHFSVAIRILRKNKVFTLINIGGLTIGISAILLITLYILHELSFDRFHDKTGRIYRLTTVVHTAGEARAQAVTSTGMGPWLGDNFPEVERWVRIGDSERRLSYQEVRIHDTRIWYADSSLFDIFSYKMLRGNPRTALVEPYSIILSKSSAKKFFGDEDPYGKVMSLSDTMPLRVTGIIEDIPSNTHLPMDVILSRSTVAAMWQEREEYNHNWRSNIIYTYLLMADEHNVLALEEKIKPALRQKMAIIQKELGSTVEYDFHFQPITDIHLRSQLNNEVGVNGNIVYIYTFAVVAILVLLIACANYVNLSTAKSFIRAKETGVRKIVGAERVHLIGQLLSESMLVSSIAFVVATGIAIVSLPYFNTLLGVEIQTSLMTKGNVMIGFASLFVLIGLLAGCYPAFYLSGFSPLKVLTLQSGVSSANSLVRKILVVFQFTISIILLVGILVVVRQINFIQNRNLGIEKEQLVELKLQLPVQPKWQLLKSELQKNSSVVNATASDFSYTRSLQLITVRPEGEADDDAFRNEAAIAADNDFIETFGIEVIAGRNFDANVTEEERTNMIINQTMAKEFGWQTPENALGRELNFPGGFKMRVIGVVKDFNFSSLRENVKPLALHLFVQPRFITLKLKTENIISTMSQLEKSWNRIEPEFPLEHTFVDENFRKLYKAEEQTSMIIGWLAGLATFIGCLGLFGLAAFMAEQRAREIGIRKVLGATASNIVQLLSGEFVILITLSILLGSVVAWYSVDQWLQSFAYRIDMPWWAFVVAGLAAIMLTLLTISYQSITAALRNPIDVLKSQ